MFHPLFLTPIYRYFLVAPAFIPGKWGEMKIGFSQNWYAGIPCALISAKANIFHCFIPRPKGRGNLYCVLETSDVSPWPFLPLKKAAKEGGGLG